MKYRRLYSGASLSLAAAIALVLAPAMQANAKELEEIVVTAQKREQSLQDVPISVSAVTGDKIEDAGLARMDELSEYVPNFSVRPNPIGDSINIRGIQTGANAGFEQSVATYVDGVYRGRNVQSRFAFLDVERLEVLRGPQGTLFGKNTIGGALNIRSGRPTDEFSSGASFSMTPEFEQTDVSGYISGPLNDSLRFRVAMLKRDMREGWVTNNQYIDTTHGIDELATRATLEWDVSDATTATLRYEYGTWDNKGFPWVIGIPGSLQPFLDGAGIAYGPGFETSMGNNGFPLLGMSGDDVLDFGSVNKFFGDTRETSLTVNHEMESGSTLTAILAKSSYQYDRFLDADFNPLPVVRFDDTEDFEQTSMEIRLASNTGGKLEYITGAYFQKYDMLVDGLSQFSANTLNTLLGGGCAAYPDLNGNMIPDAIERVVSPAATGGNANAAAFATAQGVSLLPGSSAALANACAQYALTNFLTGVGVDGAARYAYLDQSSDTWAAFAQTTWHISDKWQATLGLRYTDEQKEAAQGAYAAEYAAESHVPVNPAGADALAAYLVGEFTPHAYTPADPGMQRHEKSLTWSFNTQWSPTDTTMAYLAASTGFKAGGFNSFYMGQSAGAGADSNDVDFEDEEVFSVEVGAKWSLLDGAAELNVALFNTEFDNLQASIFSGNTTYIVQNAAEATTRGLEIEGRWMATEKLMLEGAFGWIDFEYGNFPNQGCTAVQFTDHRNAAFASALAADPSGAAAALVALRHNNQVCASAGINDFAGRGADNTPEFTASVRGSYFQPIGDYELVLSLDANYIDDVFRAGDQDPLALQPAYTKFNGSITFGPNDGSWDIGIVGKNLTDELIMAYMNDTPLFNGTHQAAFDAPRSFAIRGRVKF